MIDEADRDGDGEVSPEEFERIMRVCLAMLLLFTYTGTPQCTDQ